VDFASATPFGAAPKFLALFGQVYRADNERVAPGARVEAFVGNMLCGVASVRGGSFDGYVMHVVGPDGRMGCRTDGSVSFRVDGVRIAKRYTYGMPAPQQWNLTLP